MQPQEAPGGPQALPPSGPALSPLCESPHGPGLGRAAGLPGPKPPTQPQRAVSDPSKTRPLAPQKDTEQEASAQMGGKVPDGQRTVFPRGPHWPVLWLPGQWGGDQSDASCLHTGLAQVPFLVTDIWGRKPCQDAVPASSEWGAA